MKKTYFLVLLIAAFFIFENAAIKVLNSRGLEQQSLVNKIKGVLVAQSQTDQNKTKTSASEEKKKTETLLNDDTDSDKKNNSDEYTFPDFYRGIYLNVYSSKNTAKLKKFVKMAKESHINAFVMDCQSSRYKKNIVPPENVAYVLKNGIHPIARIVVFPLGLKYYPVSKKYIESKLVIAESACKAGFKEIQFDYIRFSDSSHVRRLSLKQKYAFINSFLSQAKKRLKKYNVKIAADVFGRIPLNKNDIIGQKMEELDKVVDIICPMAYPSHYTWSKKLIYNPYYTVYITSKRARERAKNAEIVTYIQAFKMKLGSIPYSKYVRDQIKGVHDAKIKGFLMWNARQIYTVPLNVTKNYYSKQDKVAKVE